MKRILLPVFFLIMSCSVHSADEDIFYSESLNLGLNMDSQIEMVPESSDYEIDYADVKLFFYPVDDWRQDIINVETSPHAGKNEDYYLFRWNTPQEKVLSYSLYSDVETHSQFREVYDKVPFPLTGTADFQEYTEPTELIEVSDDITILSSSLAEGETDLYAVVFKLADWVKANIKYDLNTITADATKSSTWVLLHREGVCDEITTLFIAMCRSLGIPARFAAGVSYSNSELFSEPWGLHGWAEVYFPGTGWVPFDVTYGQFGYIDAGHIKLSDSVDADKSSSRFEWKARDVDIDPSPLETSVDIQETGSRITDEIILDVNIFAPIVGYGSYNLIEASLKNTKPYYVTTELAISKPKEVSVKGEQRQQVMLRPRQEKKVYWIVKVEDSLRKGYTYTFPVAVESSRGSVKESAFKASEGKIIYTENLIGKILDEEAEEEEKTYSKNIIAECSAPSKVLVGEHFNVSCTTRNSGNMMLNDLRICLEDSCFTDSLGIAQEKTKNFVQAVAGTGEHTLIFTARNGEVSAAKYLSVYAADIPSLIIGSLSYPDNVNYDDEFDIEFRLLQDSVSEPKNINLKFLYNYEAQVWNLEEVDAYQPFRITLKGSMLGLNKNRFIINVTFYDDNEGSFSMDEEFYITLNEPTFWQKVKIWLNTLGNKLMRIL